MTRNYTETRRYLQRVENKYQSIEHILQAERETRTAGGSASDLESKRLSESRAYCRLCEEVEKKIDRIGDDKLRVILKRRYLKFQTGNQIRSSMGWSEKYMRQMSERALMNMEVILLQDGILGFVDPTADMMRDYEDGKRRGFDKGKAEGYASGYDAGYSAGFKRGATGQPYDMAEDFADVYRYEDADDQDEND